MSICVWCHTEFPAFTARNGTVKVFCTLPCRAEFNREGCRLGREYLYRMAKSIDIPLKDAILGGIPTILPQGPGRPRRLPT